ncbi:hypothetical protein F5B17DRAFT_453984 [Nemania serpens]|nr:hypothetical protein F5B17DRAFT_453984 [Nemania serpens]
MSKEDIAATGLPTATEQDRIDAIMAALPPVKLMCSSDSNADAHHTSILAVCGLHTTATGDVLRTLAGLALLNTKITISPSSVHSDDAPPTTTPDTADAGAVATHDHEGSRDEGIHSPEEYDDEEANDYGDFLSMPWGIEVTFEPFYFFFYGSLQVRSVLEAVCDINDTEDHDDENAIVRTNASISGWKIKMWGPYPALIPAIADADADGEEGRVSGMAWLCEKHEHVVRLCAYETNAYRIAYCDVEVPSADGNGVEVLKNARTFVSVLPADELGTGEFDVENYRDNVLGLGDLDSCDSSSSVA